MTEAAAKVAGLTRCPMCCTNRLCAASLICTGCGAELTQAGLEHYRRAEQAGFAGVDPIRPPERHS